VFLFHSFGSFYIVFPSWRCRNLVRKKRAGWSSCAKFQRGRSHRDISQIILGLNPHEPLSSFIGWLHYNLVLSGMKKRRMLDHTPLPTKKGKTVTHNCSGGHSSPHVFQTHRMINSSILFPMRFYFFHEREYCTNEREPPFNFCPVAKNWVLFKWILDIYLLTHSRLMEFSMFDSMGNIYCRAIFPSNILAPFIFYSPLLF